VVGLVLGAAHGNPRCRELMIAAALAELAERSDTMAQLIGQHGSYEPRRAQLPDVFAALAKAIIYQQLAGKAANSIHRRFSELLDGPVTAAGVLDLDPAAIRGAGLSGAKRDAVVDLAQHVVDGKVGLDSLDGLDDEALVGSLVRVRGIGPWTAQMFMLFELGRLDVWPTGDLGVRKGFGHAFDLEEVPSARQLQPLGEPFRPYRSIVAWYCWRAIDTATPDR
jgi:3-methyladenine DNA glycosylase/8-oxoguanine DNA glycosylase